MLRFLRENQSKLPGLQETGSNRAFHFISQSDNHETLQEDDVANYYDKQRKQNKDFL